MPDASFFYYLRRNNCFTEVVDFLNQLPDVLISPQRLINLLIKLKQLSIKGNNQASLLIYGVLAHFNAIKELLEGFYEIEFINQTRADLLYALFLHAKGSNHFYLELTTISKSHRLEALANFLATIREIAQTGNPYAYKIIHLTIINWKKIVSILGANIPSLKQNMISCLLYGEGAGTVCNNIFAKNAAFLIESMVINTLELMQNLEAKHPHKDILYFNRVKALIENKIILGCSYCAFLEQECNPENLIFRLRLAIQYRTIDSNDLERYCNIYTTVDPILHQQKLSIFCKEGLISNITTAQI